MSCAYTGCSHHLKACEHYGHYGNYYFMVHYLKTCCKNPAAYSSIFFNEPDEECQRAKCLIVACVSLWTLKAFKGESYFQLRWTEFHMDWGNRDRITVSKISKTMLKMNGRGQSSKYLAACPKNDLTSDTVRRKRGEKNSIQTFLWYWSCCSLSQS